MFGKSKASPKSNPKAAGPEPAEIVALMAKIVERLDALERKTDLVISQTSARSFERGGHSRPAPQPVVPSQPFRPPVLPVRPNEVNPPPGHPQGHSHGRREKMMHKAVCADCQKDCEIPFKPTGERPVYCKECFSKRKSPKPSRVEHVSQPAPELPVMPKPAELHQRQVSVTKKGVGKVTVSEIVQPSEQAVPSKKKNPTPEKKSRR
ncbi:MAG: CxxC-x17-CxxC domain-containing protein [Candidatus Omnitrophota bacterium]